MRSKYQVNNPSLYAKWQIMKTINSYGSNKNYFRMDFWGYAARKSRALIVKLQNVMRGEDWELCQTKIQSVSSTRLGFSVSFFRYISLSIYLPSIASGISKIPSGGFGRRDRCAVARAEFSIFLFDNAPAGERGGPLRGISRLNFKRNSNYA